MNGAVASVNLKHFPLLRRGKVRDVFDLGPYLLLVASDRISAFDVVLPSLLPQKGVILTDISRHWFDLISDLGPTQISGLELDQIDFEPDELEQLAGRSVIVHKAERVDIECIVRDYLAGSVWLEYRTSGTVAGVSHPPGLKRGDRLPETLFTPAIKNDDGHDENISIARLESIVGGDLAHQLERLSRAFFARGSAISAQAGFVLADTKFEFGWIDGKLAVIDEVLTPDSSRYWDTSDLKSGHEPPAYDKQPVRDWLEASGWNKQAPGPELPGDIIDQTLYRYRSVWSRLQNIQTEGA